MSRSTIKAGVVGASGYTGSELVRLLASHPQFECDYATSRQYANQSLSELYPEFKDQVEITLEEPSLERMKEYDLLFLAVPHGTSMDLVPDLDDGERIIIDLAGDYRISDPDRFEQAYGTEHSDPDRLSEFTYGLAEYNQEELASARLIANPGCYVTSVLMPLFPLAERGWLDPDSTIFVDSKSGISGAGRTPSETKLFMNVNDNVKPYKIGTHRHQAEMIHHLPAHPALRFVPHVVSAERGIESAIYLQPSGTCSSSDVKDCYQDLEATHPLLRYRETPAGIKSVSGTPFCDLSVHGDETGLIVISTLDNLLKGAASQAIQNANLSHGFASETGLISNQ